MKDIEQWLREQPLSEPSPALDKRVDRLFQVHRTPARIVSRPVPLWLSAAACLVCFAGGMLASFGFRSAPLQSNSGAVTALQARPVAAKGNVFDWSAPVANSPISKAYSTTLVMEMKPLQAPEVDFKSIVIEKLES